MSEKQTNETAALWALKHIAELEGQLEQERHAALYWKGMREHSTARLLAHGWTVLVRPECGDYVVSSPGRGLGDTINEDELEVLAEVVDEVSEGRDSEDWQLFEQRCKGRGLSRRGA